MFSSGRASLKIMKAKNMKKSKSRPADCEAGRQTDPGDGSDVLSLPAP
jgi:hypothetical protein